MLNRNIIEGIKNALDKATTSKYSELEERLNICKMTLGTYNPVDADFIQFKNASIEDFEIFYKKYLYRKDAIVPEGSGIIFSLNRILQKIDEFRSQLNIDQNELDTINNMINDSKKKIESFIDLKLAIKKSSDELLLLNEEKYNLDVKAQEYEKLQNQINELKSLVDLKRESLSRGKLDEVKKQIYELKINFNSGMDINRAEEIIRQCCGIGLLDKVNIDLFCEYIEDKQICEKLEEACLIEGKKLKEIENYEVQLNVVFKNYLECLSSIIKALPPRKDTVGTSLRERIELFRN
ncbi:MAG: hypothetical protein LBF05_01330 [Tannerella sp.]|jgi:hypothetical protein|nr:hypothetical protein [Tannerella sp.]